MLIKLTLALISGILLALGWPTYGFPLFLFFGFVPLLWVERQLRTSHTRYKGLKLFLCSYISFFIWNALTTWWLWYATVFGMCFAVLVNALLMSMVFQLFFFVSKKTSDKAGLIFLVALWISFEKFHLIWEFSWPWLNLGNGFASYSDWVQWYEYTGAFGGSLWVWIVNVGMFKTLLAYRRHKHTSVCIRGCSINGLIIVIPIVISLFMADRYVEDGADIDVVVLQPNIDPYTEKYGKTNSFLVKDLLQLTAIDSTDYPDFVIAPETALAASAELNDFPYTAAYAQIYRFVKQHPGLNFITGVNFYQRYFTKEMPTPTANRSKKYHFWYDVYNSAFMLNDKNMPQLYHKSKLVVGVENFPYRSFLKPIFGDIMIDLGGTVATHAKQKEPNVFTNKNRTFKTAPIICYESVYGSYISDYVRKGADFLTIITNDGWWRDTEGHRQHLAYAKLRAIETRRSIARSANTGISAFINQKGEVTASLPYAAKGKLRAKIKANDKLTFYVKYGDYIARIASFITLLLFLSAIARTMIRKKRNYKGKIIP